MSVTRRRAAVLARMSSIAAMFTPVQHVRLAYPIGHAPEQRNASPSTPTGVISARQCKVRLAARHTR
ncbi:hypothetical protein JK2ML_0950 [Mycobacterium leprae Kyoto-2]|uniref:Uncharacterized protein n=3 Tax=Mycobacterium leprae TaxID=1769 RepID=Q9CCD0_MYCLE|nr:hypothetical protein DIJ64_05100 [Mycobacterium leprae]OAR20722.1 hypothetical protein A8144_09550 [Mycobacterium leprae 3125609]OAX70885.1 hypothetical protein A3216_09225 [Mycobacterium leprae 7935681]CAR71045.1 hypothetical protein MLBr00950 [Mycobacterium leprae Br4923]BBC16879.1 hypothetical protein JK2ML_0950 [Mycobacterium leprae Kyoto-2]